MYISQLYIAHRLVISIRANVQSLILQVVQYIGWCQTSAVSALALTGSQQITAVIILFFLLTRYSYFYGMAFPTNNYRCRQAWQHSLSFFHSLVTYVTFAIAMSNERLPGTEEDRLIRSLTASLHTLSLEGVSVQQMIEQKKRRKLVELRFESAVRE